LVDYSLMRKEVTVDGEPRFAMLETIREFGVGQLAAHGDTEQVRTAHAHHFLVLAEEVAPLLKGPEQRRWLDRLEADHGNLRAALGWFAQEDDGEAALRLAGTLARFWWVRGHLSEGSAWYERLLAAARDRPVDPAVRARALTGAAILAHLQRDLDRSAALLEEGLGWARTAGDAREIADALNSLGRVAVDRGDLDRATGWFEAAIPHYQAANHPQGLAGCRNNLAVVWRERGEFDRAVPLFEEALSGFRAAGEERGVGLAANNLGFLATLRGDPATAAAYHREGLAVYRQIGDRIGLATSLENIAQLAYDAGQPAEAVRLLAAAAALRAAIGSAAGSDSQAQVERTLAAARAALDASTFASAWQSGSAFSLDRAIELAWRIVESPPPAAPSGAAPAGDLTEREIEVLRLVAVGRTDREIGEALAINPRTASRHVANIYRKLDLHSRAEATAFARRRGLA
jgi:non-specific serine/threonine protein kinase